MTLLAVPPGHVPTRITPARSPSSSPKSFPSPKASRGMTEEWTEGMGQIAEGDEVVLCGKVTKYKTTYETSSKKAYVYSINGKTE